MSGTTCFINRGRLCGSDCRAYNVAAEDCQFMVIAHTAVGALGEFVQQCRVGSFTITGTAQEDDNQSKDFRRGHSHG